VHLVGIAGSGMKALAEWLVGRGRQVSGSDERADDAPLAWLRARGVRIQQGHQSLQMAATANLVVYSPAVPESNPERRAAAARRIPQRSYPEFLAELTAAFPTICVAGTHGKSTTAAMAGHLLRRAGADPQVIVGAEFLDRGVNGWAGRGGPFVLESCEYQRHFLKYQPRWAAILSVEPDHFDCYADFSQARNAFAQFASRVAPDGLLVVGADSPAAMEAASARPGGARPAAAVETFGFDPGADWRARGLRREANGVGFQIERRGELFADATLPIPGVHNVLNALAAAALCAEQGLSAAQIAAGLADFPGVARRFEIRGTWRGVTLIDDYAHHPTAVKAVLRTARSWFEGRRIVCAFQPHQISRTRRLLADFAASLALADFVAVPPVYAAREDDDDGELHGTLADLVAQRGVPARACGSLDQTVCLLEDSLRPGDVLLTLGAGNIDQIQHAFSRRLPRHHDPR